MNAITRTEKKQLDVKQVTFRLNGRAVTGKETETIMQVAEREGVEIPRLCYQENIDTAGNCRSCVVEIRGERVLAPSCCRNVKEGIEVITNNARAVKSQRMVLELLQSNMPEAHYTRNNEVDKCLNNLF